MLAEALEPTAMRAFIDGSGMRRDSIFGGRIAHGMLTAAAIPAVIRVRLPGHGTGLSRAVAEVIAGGRPGERVEAIVSVTAIDHGRRRVACAAGANGRAQGRGAGSRAEQQVRLTQGGAVVPEEMGRCGDVRGFRLER